MAIALDQQSVSAQKGSQTGKYILLHQMARNPYEFRHQILNVFFPARDSTAIVFGNVLFELAQHSHIWDELRAEVTSFGPYQQFMFELLEELKTTESIISETLCMAHRACCAQRYRTTNRRRTRWALAAIRTERPSRRHGTLHPTTDPRMWEDDAEKLVLGLGVMVGLCGKRIGSMSHFLGA